MDESQMTFDVVKHLKEAGLGGFGVIHVLTFRVPLSHIHGQI